MTSFENTTLENNIQRFHSEYASVLQALAQALNEACISHYSSGCGIKKVTHDIFPAAGHVTDLLDMVRLDRNHRPTNKMKSDTGLKDVSSHSEYNPAIHFLQYMRRWSSFAEQVMQREGASARGVAAARAKLIMADLMVSFSPQPSPKAVKLSAKIGALPSKLDFPGLMQAIGLSLESHTRNGTENTTVSVKQRMEQNYRHALAAASGSVKTAQAA